MSERTFDLRPNRCSGAQTNEAPGANAAATRRRVLLVDDSVDACLAQSLLLKMRGYEVQTVTSGRDALAAYERFKPEIVLMDLGMPEMSGFDVVRQLRGKPGGERSLFIAVSGRGEEEDRNKAREAGFHRYAIKPVDLADLEEMFHAAPDNSGGPETN
jgi:CheY-like chemotaxis protein